MRRPKHLKLVSPDPFRDDAVIPEIYFQYVYRYRVMAQMVRSRNACN